MTQNPYWPVSYASALGSPFTLTPSWMKVATVDASTKALRLAPIAAATIYDIEWTVVPAGSAAPADPWGEPIQGGEDFASGLPTGDVYCKSASGQLAVVHVGT